MKQRLVAALPVLRLVGFVVAVAVVAGMGVEAVRDAPSRSLTWTLVVCAILPAGAWWLSLGWGWGVLAEGRATRAQLGTWCRTQVLRYLPGGIWAPVSRVAVLPGGALDRVSTVAAENVIALCAALTVGGVALAAAGQWWWAALVIAAAVPTLAARLAAGRTRVAPDRALRVSAGYTAGFVAYVISAVLVQAAISGWTASLTVAGGAAVAWAAGLVVIIAPGGVGVREVVYVALLAGTLARADLTAGAVMMRVVTIAAELAVLLVAGRPPTRTVTTSADRVHLRSGT